VIEEIIGNKMDLTVNPRFSYKRERPVRIRELSNRDLRSLTEADPAYGDIVCLCSKVSRGEIRDALRSLFPREAIPAGGRGTGILTQSKNEPMPSWEIVKAAAVSAAYCLLRKRSLVLRLKRCLMTQIVDACIIGAGAAGAAAALRLKQSGIDNILLIDRGIRTGGILNQCIHPGFGLSYFRKELTGPQYANSLDKMLDQYGVRKIYNTAVLDVETGNGNTYHLTLSSGDFPLEEILTRVVILTTGSFERTRENISVAGTRPLGVFTAGSAQRLINIDGTRIGHRVVIQGSGDIGLIMARRLSIEGYEVVRVLERLPYLSGLLRNKIQCLDDFGIKLSLGKEITEITGYPRVKGVWVGDSAEREKDREFVPCDTVLFAIGLIPEAELLKETGIPGLLGRGGLPIANNRFESPLSGVFTAGNALHVNDLADSASIEGEKAADAAIEYLTDQDGYIRSRREGPPYREAERPKLTTSYFNDIEGKIICVICPKGCVLSDGEFGCMRGRKFLETERTLKLRIFTTTVSIRNGDRISRYAVRSVHPIPLASHRTIKERISEGEPFTSPESFLREFGEELSLTDISAS
jgi:NADPH-dependent 2,4-dienoyl-CoA reductase/sulfur reductase-like enzyme